MIWPFKKKVITDVESNEPVETLDETQICVGDTVNTMYGNYPATFNVTKITKDYQGNIKFHGKVNSYLNEVFTGYYLKTGMQRRKNYDATVELKCVTL